MTGLFLRQGERAGWPGLAGFVLLQTGIVLTVVAIVPQLVARLGAVLLGLSFLWLGAGLVGQQYGGMASERTILTN